MDGLEKIPYEDHPKRCQWVSNNRQCGYMQEPEKKYCPMHSSVGHPGKNTAARNYQLNKYKDRVDAFADNSQIKNLREEIGMLRMGLETIWNRCEGETELLSELPKIVILVEKIEKLVVSANKLESSLNLLLDKQQVVQMAMEISQIISLEITDPEILERISSKIAQSLDRIGSSVFNE